RFKDRIAQIAVGFKGMGLIYGKRGLGFDLHRVQDVAKIGKGERGVERSDRLYRLLEQGRKAALWPGVRFLRSCDLISLEIRERGIVQRFDIQPDDEDFRMGSLLSRQVIEEEHLFGVGVWNGKIEEAASVSPVKRSGSKFHGAAGTEQETFNAMAGLKAA